MRGGVSFCRGALAGCAAGGALDDSLLDALAVHVGRRRSAPARRCVPRPYALRWSEELRRQWQVIVDWLVALPEFPRGARTVAGKRESFAYPGARMQTFMDKRR